MVLENYISDTRVVAIDKMYGLTYRIISVNPEEEVIKFMTDFRMENKIKVFTEIGFDIPVSQEEQDQGKRGYEYWIIVDEQVYNNHKDGEIVAKILPKGKYLMLTISEPFMDPFERIPKGWKKLWGEVEKSYERPAQNEVYGFEEKVDTLAGTDMNIYVRIK